MEIKTEIKLIEGSLYYEIFVNETRHLGTYVFENWLKEIMELKDKLQFGKLK